MLILMNTAFEPGSTGVLASGPRLKIKALLWAALLFAIALAFLFASVLGSRWLGLRGNWAYLPPIALPVVACCVYVLLVRALERRPVSEFRLSATISYELPLGFLFGGIFITAMWLFLLSLGFYTLHRGVWTDWFNDLVADSYISAVLEELAFRAILLRIISRAWGVRIGVLVSSIIFGLAHFTHGSWLGELGIIINAANAMGLLYVITGRLWMSIGMHLGYDFIETSVLGINSNHGFLVSAPKTGVAIWLTGGTFGPDAAVPAMIFGLLINLFLWRSAFGRITSLNTTTNRRNNFPRL